MVQGLLRGLWDRRVKIHQLARADHQHIRYLRQGFHVQRDLTIFIFAHTGPAFVNQIRQLLQGQFPGLPVHADAPANMFIDPAHDSS